ncbi:MAG: hypothetical protein J0I41_07125 [Filimonas sp.]|nr:hypothetical protein [Filimonas sp.]
MYPTPKPQPPPVKDSAQPAPVKEASEISKLEDCKLPEEMVFRIKQMGPKEMSELKEEFQSNILEEDEEFTVTVKLRFIDDHIFGYIKQAPINYSNLAQISNKRIFIPIEWCCAANPTHPQHCVSTLKEVQAYSTTQQCAGWKQKDDGSSIFAKPELPEKGRKGRKKKVITGETKEQQ